MHTHNLGYARTGTHLRRAFWQLQREVGIDLIPSNDFTAGDRLLHTAAAVGVPHDGRVPLFSRDQSFTPHSSTAADAYTDARRLGLHTKPVLLGPVSFLLLGREAEDGFHRIELIERLLPAYLGLVDDLRAAGATWIQFDEPCLAKELTPTEQEAIRYAYRSIHKHFRRLHLLLTTYDGGYGDNLTTALSLPVDALHLDLVACPGQLASVLDSPALSKKLQLSLGVVDGRGVVKTDRATALKLIDRAVAALGEDRVMLAPSCPLPHTDGTTDFARQVLEEIVALLELTVDQSASPYGTGSYLRTP